MEAFDDLRGMWGSWHICQCMRLFVPHLMDLRLHNRLVKERRTLVGTRQLVKELYDSFDESREGLLRLSTICARLYTKPEGGADSWCEKDSRDIHSLQV